MRICMFVWNTFTSDSRVLKEAETLMDAGHEVLVVAVAGKNLPVRENRGGLSIVRVPLVGDLTLQLMAVCAYLGMRFTGPLRIWKLFYNWLANTRIQDRKDNNWLQSVFAFIKLKTLKLKLILSRLIFQLTRLIKIVISRFQATISTITDVLKRWVVQPLTSILKFTTNFLIKPLKKVKVLILSLLPFKFTELLHQSRKRIWRSLKLTSYAIRNRTNLLFHSLRHRTVLISNQMMITIRNIRQRLRHYRIQIAHSLMNLPKRLLRPYAPQLRMYAYFLPATSIGVAWDADVYHSHDFNTLNVGVVCSRLNHSRLVYDSHELYAERKLPEGRDEKQERRYVIRREQRLIKKADAVITVSDVIANELSRRYRINKPYIVLNCAKEVPAIQSRETSWIKDLVPTELSSLILLYVGGITFGRGLEQAIQSLLYLNEAALVMVGPDRRNFRKGLYQFAEEIDVSDRVFYHSPIYYEKIPLLCREATVGLVLNQNISLNNYYGLPNKLFEYLLGGLPVVASNFPAIREVIEDSKAGVLCNSADPVSIANAVRDVTHNPEKYRSYTANARTAALDRYNWNRQAKILLDVYSKIGP